MDDLASALYAACPSGVGKGGRLRLDEHELERACREGGEWARKEGFGTESDVARTEEGGFLHGADFSKVSHRARERGRPQMGTLGAGNHFIEVEVVDEVFDDEAARVMGLSEGCLTVMIHCGSRGFGHQICTDYVKKFQKAVQRYGIRLPDRELVCAPLDSPEGKAYEGAMRAAANYAFANRQVLAHLAREAFAKTLRGRSQNVHLHQVYDIAHNMGKTEEHEIDGKHDRSASTARARRAPSAPASRDCLPSTVPSASRCWFRARWAPPRGFSSAPRRAWSRSLGSCCHGAGRTMSRRQAKRSINGGELRRELEGPGIKVRAGSMPGLAEEAPKAYKDVDARGRRGGRRRYRQEGRPPPPRGRHQGLTDRTRSRMFKYRRSTFKR